MRKEKLVMVSSKVLNQMLAYRKHNRYYASYREASESIKTEIEKLRSDSFRISILKNNIQSSPSMFIRSFQNQLICIASKSLLTAAECSGEHKLYNEIFDCLFEVAGEMFDQLIEEGDQYYDNAIIEKFEDFESGIINGYANTVLLYHIAVYCIFLYNYIDVNSNPIAVKVKI